MAVHDFRSQRLFVEADIAKDIAIDATREQANYLLNVLRISDGEKILMFNGRDGEWEATVEAKGRKKCSLVPNVQTREQPERPTLVYCFAPLKQARLDYMVQKAVEMGVGTLQPVITEHTQVRQIKEHRVHSNAVEAAEQCGILNLPLINEPIRLKDLLSTLAPDTHLVFCDEAKHHENGLESLRAEASSNIALLIGPEGGFSDAERAVLSEFPSITVLGLGPRILRADTAAVAALAIIQAVIGDWYK